MVDFDQFLNTDINNNRIIFEYYINLLSSLSKDNYSIHSLLKLNGSASKFIDCISTRIYVEETKEAYIHIVKDLSANIRLYNIRENRLRLLPTSKSKLLVSYEHVYNHTIQLISRFNSVKSNNNDIELNGLFTPELINKTQIIRLITEAIDLIENDITLSRKTKDKLKTYLIKVIHNLEDSHSSWALILGTIKETIIILAALGSIAGGISSIIPAKEKLIQTTEIIEKTSISINYNTINQTFNNSQELIYNNQLHINAEELKPLVNQKQLSLEEKDF